MDVYRGSYWQPVAFQKERGARRVRGLKTFLRSSSVVLVQPISAHARALTQIRQLLAS